jgi:hypothetical protein
MNVRYPLYLSLLFLGISLCLAWVMAESLDDKHKAGKINWRKANPFYALREALKYRRFLLFSGPFFLSQLAECVYQFIVLYTKRRFNWGYVTLGFYISITGICLAVVQGNLRFIVPKIVSENGCVTTGLFGHSVAMSVMSVASKGWMMGLCVLPQVRTCFRSSLPFSFSSLHSSRSRKTCDETPSFLSSLLPSLPPSPRWSLL